MINLRHSGVNFHPENQHLKAVQNRALRFIGGYDWYTRVDRIYPDLENIKLKSFIKHSDSKLQASARFSRNHYIKRLGADSLVDNRRIPKPVHIIDYVEGAQWCALDILSWLPELVVLLTVLVIKVIPNRDHSRSFRLLLRMEVL
jgi:hypothetical protein